jgi:hypothetical protein
MYVPRFLARTNADSGIVVAVKSEGANGEQPKPYKLSGSKAYALGCRKTDTVELGSRPGSYKPKL